MTSETGYKWDPVPILGAKKTPVYMAKKIADGQSVRDVLQTYIEVSLTEGEISQVEKAKTVRKGQYDPTQHSTYFRSAFFLRLDNLCPYR